MIPLSCGIKQINKGVAGIETRLTYDDAAVPVLTLLLLLVRRRRKQASVQGAGIDTGVTEQGEDVVNETNKQDESASIRAAFCDSTSTMAFSMLLRTTTPPPPPPPPYASGSCSTCACITSPASKAASYAPLVSPSILGL
jgi:hypothetical protein